MSPFWVGFKRESNTPLKIISFLNKQIVRMLNRHKLEFDFHEIFVTIKFFVASPNATTWTFLNSKNGFKESLTQNLFPNREIISRPTCACKSYTLGGWALDEPKPHFRYQYCFFKPSKLWIVIDIYPMGDILWPLIYHTRIWLPV